jgi:lysine 2,3-aminomutase
VYISPVVHPGEYFCYFDPIHLLPAEGQARWARPEEHDKIIDEAVAIARSRA